MLIFIIWLHKINCWCFVHDFYQQKVKMQNGPEFILTTFYFCAVGQPASTFADAATQGNYQQ